MDHVAWSNTDKQIKMTRLTAQVTKLTRMTSDIIYDYESKVIRASYRNATWLPEGERALISADG